jgi:hypothetical protein
MISQVCLALNHTSFGEMIERCDSLGDLVERGEVAVVSDMDEFVTIVAADQPVPMLPWLWPAGLA